MKKFLRAPFLLAILFMASASAIYFKKDESGVYNGRDATNLARAGWFNCYKGGSWMPQVTVHDLLIQACGTKEYMRDPNHIKFDPSLADANGTYPHQEFTHLMQLCLTTEQTCNKPTAAVKFTADIVDTNDPTTRADEDTCRWAMQRIIDICHGEHEDTRGGYYVFDGDGTSYGFDVAEKW